MCLHGSKSHYLQQQNLQDPAIDLASSTVCTSKCTIRSYYCASVKKLLWCFFSKWKKKNKFYYTSEISVRVHNQHYNYIGPSIPTEHGWPLQYPYRVLHNPKNSFPQ